jgi:hypothetical protein
VVRALVVSRFVSRRIVPVLAKIGPADLLVLRELIEAGSVAPVIDRTYPLDERLTLCAISERDTPQVSSSFPSRSTSARSRRFHDNWTPRLRS